jgi:hypothetical protein
VIDVHVESWLFDEFLALLLLFLGGAEAEVLFPRGERQPVVHVAQNAAQAVNELVMGRLGNKMGLSHLEFSLTLSSLSS